MRAPAARARQRGFFDFSMPELAIIFTVALVVLGPKKLPPLVQQVGRWIGRARHMARQFRDQLEQEVNSINAVKPVPQPVTPEVGPAAPGTAPAPDIVGAATGTADMGVIETQTPAVVEAPPGSDVHPEAQIYFSMNGAEPEVVAENPHAPLPVADDPQAAAAQPPSEAGHDAAPPAAQPKEPPQPATVEVLFPHDHG